MRPVVLLLILIAVVVSVLMFVDASERDAAPEKDYRALVQCLVYRMDIDPWLQDEESMAGALRYCDAFIQSEGKP